MESVLLTLGELKAHVSLLVKQNADNETKILSLEKKLFESEGKIKQLEEKNSVFVKNDEKLQKLKKRVAQLEQQQQQQIQDANDKFKKGEKLQHVLNSAILKNAVSHGKIEQISTKLDSVSKAVDKIKNINTRLDSVSKAVEGYAKAAFDKVFSVKLNHTPPLAKDVQIRLNSVEKIFVPSPAFNSTSVSFKPPCDGVYALNIEVCQTGGGEMSVCLCSQARVSYVGRTKGHMLETSVMKVKKLTEGQDHWIEIKVLQGSPIINYCNFSGFLITKGSSS